MAICGTVWFKEFEPYLKGYDRVIVALDEDAIEKSVTMAKEIGLIVPTETRLLKKDLKYATAPEMELLLKHNRKIL
jgi:hypothetical protein